MEMNGKKELKQAFLIVMVGMTILVGMIIVLL
jgi:hypothetical protein